MDRGTDARDVLEGRALSRTRLVRGGEPIAVRHRLADGHGDGGKRTQILRREARRVRAVNTGTNTLVRMLVEILGQNVRRQVPKIQEAIESSARAMEDELARLGEGPSSDRGALTHECCYRAAPSRKISPPRSTRGWAVGVMRAIFEERLVGALRAIDLRAFYSQNVKAVIDASDGYQPHLVAPEMGIRRLIELGLDALHDPSRSASERSIACFRTWWNARWSDRRGRNPSPGAGVDGDRKPVVVFVTASRIHPRVPRQALGQIVDRRDGRVFDRRSRRRPSREALRRFRRFARAVATPLRRARSTKREAESMVAALVAMEVVLRRRFFRRLGARELSNESNGIRATAASRSRRIFASSPRTSLPSQPSTAPTRTCERSPPASTRTSMPSAREWPRRFEAVVHCRVLRARRGLLAGFYASLGGISARTFAGWRRTRRRRGGGKRVARD